MHKSSLIFPGNQAIDGEQHLQFNSSEVNQACISKAMASISCLKGYKGVEHPSSRSCRMLITWFHLPQLCTCLITSRAITLHDTTAQATVSPNTTLPITSPSLPPPRISPASTKSSEIVVNYPATVDKTPVTVDKTPVTITLFVA